MLDGEQIQNWTAPQKAAYWMGQDGLRIYSPDDTSRVLLFVDACATTDLRKLARDALGCDKLRLSISGAEYEIDQPHHMARDILLFTS